MFRVEYQQNLRKGIWENWKIALMASWKLLIITGQLL
jgi:hypothetical protein